ncbi:glycoside hydrolase 3 protein [Mycoblastus sanguinarius]|nr:glycoside hydrolase 3 protein [Mycoblastus sanguinarius]
MRFSSLVAVAAATAPVAVFAKGRMGYALGSRLPDGSCKTTSDYVADFAVLKDTSTFVRTYSAVDAGDSSGPVCYVPGALLPAAQQAGFQVVIGLWADTDTAFNADVTEFMKYAKQYQSAIYAVTVGSEALYRNQQDSTTGLTASGLLSQIQSFSKTMTNAGLSFKIGTADSWNKYQDGTADPIISSGLCTILLVNAFGYWQQQTISNATATYLDDLQQAYGRIQSVAGSTTSIELWNGETGWPTDGGTDYGAAQAGTANAQTFWKQGVCAALDWNYDVFFFEAFDEPWKPASNGADGQPGDETHWGAYKSDRSSKFSDYSCSYTTPNY